MKRLLSVALAVLAAAACSDTMLPMPGGDGDPRLEFAAESDPRDYLFPTPRASVRRLTDGIAVETMMTHPEGCRDFDADLHRSGDQLGVNVAITPTRTFAICRAGNANYTYTARIRDLAPGDYQLVVRHIYPNGDRPHVVVLSSPITID